MQLMLVIFPGKQERDGNILQPRTTMNHLHTSDPSAAASGSETAIHSPSRIPNPMELSISFPLHRLSSPLYTLSNNVCRDIFHLLTVFFHEIAVGATAIALNQPSSAARFIALLMITACVLLSIPTCFEKTHRVSYAGLLVESIISTWLQCVEKALLSHWRFTSPAAESGNTAPKKERRRCSW